MILSITITAPSHEKLFPLLLQNGFLVAGENGYQNGKGLSVASVGERSVPAADSTPEVPKMDKLPGVFASVHAIDTYPQTEWDARIAGLRKKDIYEGPGDQVRVLGGALYKDAFPVAPVVSREEARKLLKAAAAAPAKEMTDDEADDELDKADPRGKAAAKAEREAAKAAKS